MGFNQVGISALLLLVVGAGTAQWQNVKVLPPSSGLQPNNLANPSLQGSGGLPSQWLQMNPQIGGPAIVSLGVQLQSPSGAQGSSPSGPQVNQPGLPSLQAGSGLPSLQAGSGLPSLQAGSGLPSLQAGSGLPSLQAGSGLPSLQAGSGLPSLQAGSGLPSLQAGSGLPSLQAGSGLPSLQAGSGLPSLQAGSGLPSLQAGSGLPPQWLLNPQTGGSAVATPGLPSQSPSGAQGSSPSGPQVNNPALTSLPAGSGVPPQWLLNPQTGGSAVATPSISGTQGQQVLQQPLKQITWRFPVPPQLPTPPTPVHFVRQSDPVPAQGVTARCNETALHVEVSKDLFGANASFSVAALTLGGCGASGMDATSRFYIYESALYGCNSKLTVTANELVYTFILGMSSLSLSGTPIQRSAGTKLFIECHYPRLHNVSSSALLPAWIPFASAQAAEELLVFSLRLMMADWVSERPSNQYYLGEVINIEASVLQFNHVPLRVLVDSCVATAVPDLSAVPRYSFIDNYGCLVDAKLTQSSSRFLPQTQASKLDFQLEAFRFQQMNSSLIYIACLLKATAASAPADSANKACSFINNGWVAAYGADQVCSCCSSTCAMRKGRDLSSEKGLYVEREVSLGPIMVLENVW